MAAITSNAVGSLGTPALWSATSTWLGGVVPVDGDSVTIVPTAVIYPDITMSAWTTGLVGLAINGTLITPSGITNSPYILMGASITGTGNWENYMYVNPNYTFDVDFNGGDFGIRSTTLQLDFRSSEPDTRLIKLNTAAAISDTVLDITGYDTTTDTVKWNVGDTIYIAAPLITSADPKVERHTISSITSTQLTLSTGLTNAMAIDSPIALMTRNIRVTGFTNKPMQYIDNSFIRCEIDAAIVSTAYNYYLADMGDSTFDGTLHGYLRYGAWLPYQGFVFTGVMTSLQTSASRAILYWLKGGTMKNAIVLGMMGMGGNHCWLTNWIDVDVYSTRYGIDSIDNSYIKANFYGCRSCFSSCVANQIDVVADNCYEVIQVSKGISGKVVSTNCTHIDTGSSGGGSYDIILSDSDFGGATYNAGHYTDATTMPPFVQNNFKHADGHDGRSLGGKWTDDTTAPLATDYTEHIRHTCDDATEWNFRQEDAVIQPGETLSVSGWMRADTDASQKIEIIDKFADPLVDSGNSALDTDTPTHVDDTWVAVSVEYENTGEIPKSVYIRTSAKHATATMDEVWTIASSGGGNNGISPARIMGGL